jgi:hypothetical protein
VKNHDFMPENLIFSNFRGGMCRVCPPLDLPLVCLISESYDTLSLTLSYNPPWISLSPSSIVGVCIHRTPNKLSILNLNSVCIMSVCYNYDTMLSLSLGYCLLSGKTFFYTIFLSSSSIVDVCVYRPLINLVEKF